MMKNRNLLFILVLVAVVLTGCSLPGFPGSKPPGDDLEVSAGSIEGMLWDDVCVNGAEGEAPAGCVGSQPGSYRANGIFDPGEQGIPGVVIQLGEGVCPSSGAATALTDLYGFYRFEGLNPGVYCVSVDRSSAVPALTSPGVWTWPAGDAGSEGSQTVVVMNAEQLRDINFGWDDFLLPQEADAEPTSQPEEVTPEPTIVVQPTAVPACIDRAAFVSDLTVQDGTIFSPASAFTKKWRIKNTGTCTWDSTYDLVFVSGTAMGSPTAVSFNGSVKPGETVDFAVALKAPSQEGTYTGYWKLRMGTMLFSVLAATVPEQYGQKYVSRIRLPQIPGADLTLITGIFPAHLPWCGMMIRLSLTGVPLHRPVVYPPTAFPCAGSGVWSSRSPNTGSGWSLMMVYACMWTMCW